jgi:hypothetical protein
MEHFEFMGRRISVVGSGTQEDPWVVTGTAYNPALVAEIESEILDKAIRGRRWIMERSRTETGPDEEILAVLEFWVLDEDGELAMAEAWFDITEAFDITLRGDNNEEN